MHLFIFTLSSAIKSPFLLQNKPSFSSTFQSQTAHAFASFTYTSIQVTRHRLIKRILCALPHFLFSSRIRHPDESLLGREVGPQQGYCGGMRGFSLCKELQVVVKSAMQLVSPLHISQFYGQFLVKLVIDIILRLAASREPHGAT